MAAYRLRAAAFSSLLVAADLSAIGFSMSLIRG